MQMLPQGIPRDLWRDPGGVQGGAGEAIATACCASLFDEKLLDPFFDRRIILVS